MKEAAANQAAEQTMDRLQKVLAAAGIGSRRKCEEIILEGRVEIDRQTVTELGVRVDPQQQEIRVDGEVVKTSRREYYVVNKPPGVLSTNSDPSGRLRVIDLIGTKQRIFTVGRLDKSSEGLMIVTNDGDLAQQLTHPKFGCRKTYLVTVMGEPKVGDLEELKRGVRLADGFARIHDFKIKKRMKNSTIMEIVLKEGRNREIRRLLARSGHKVTQLRRIAIGPIRLADLPLGAHRRLDSREVKLLRQFSAKDEVSKKSAHGPRRKKKSVSKRSPATSESRSETGNADRTGKPGKRKATVRSKTKRSATSESRSETGNADRTGKPGKRKATARSTTKRSATESRSGGARRGASNSKPLKKKSVRGRGKKTAAKKPAARKAGGKKPPRSKRR